MPPTEVPVILVGRRALTVEDVLLLARGRAVPGLDRDPEVVRRIHATVDALDRRLEARRRSRPWSIPSPVITQPRGR